jgi:hypothetical protein
MVATAVKVVPTLRDVMGTLLTFSFVPAILGRVFYFDADSES